MTPINNNLDAQDNAKHGEELNHLAGLLFIRAASEWQWGVGLEVIAGMTMVLVSEFSIPSSIKIFIAFGGFILFAVSYYLRFVSEDTFDTAETMRRQSDLSEGLGWPVNAHQFAEWKSRAGKAVLSKFKATTREANYWETNAKPGTRRMLELTLEAAFWGRKLYSKLRIIMWYALFIIIGTALFAVTISLVRTIPGEEGMRLVSSVFLLLPAILLFDILEWIFKLGRLIEGIKEVENDLEKLEEQEDISESNILRLISEYNAVTSSGFPIHPWLYARWHDEIKELWDLRRP